MKSFDIEVTAGFYIVAAFSVLLLPWNVLLAFFIAVSIHELCHYIALRCCHVSVSQLELGVFGAKMTTGVLLPSQELICAAAGPIGSLMLGLFSKWMPIPALFGVVQGAFNLLPFYPLDGGRILHSIFMLAKKAQWDYNSADYK